MKVELFAIIKDRASAGAKAQRMIYDTFVQMGAETERFRTYEEPKAFFGEMGKAFTRATVIAAAADEGSFLEQKWNLLKALGLKSEICPAVLDMIRQSGVSTDTSMKAHALMPKEAAVFMTADGLYSGFAVKSGSQTLLFLPLMENKAQEILENGVQPYFAAQTKAAQPEPAQEPEPLNIPDNNERFAETAMMLSERDMTVAFAATQTNLYVQNGVRSNPSFGDSFIPAQVEDEPGSRESVTERIACLADSARKEIGTTLGAAISNVYSLSRDTQELFLHVALADSKSAHVRKITGTPGMNSNDMVALATDTLYTMLQDYANGAAFPPEDVEVKPIKLYENGGQSEAQNSKQKRSVAAKIAVCVAIALILCVLIGFYFKDEVAAFFDFAAAKAAETQEVSEETTEPVKDWVMVLEEESTEPESTVEYAAEDVDLALFGTVDAVSVNNSAAASFMETPAPVQLNIEDDIRPYVGAVTTTQKETTTQETTTKAETTTAKETTTAAATTAAAVQNKNAAKNKEEAVSESETETTMTTTTKPTLPALTTEKATETTTKPAEQAQTPATAEDGMFVFTVYGYGHGVGMSQLGALAYARQGWSYAQILSHYYPGTKLVRESAPATIQYRGNTMSTEEFVARSVQQEIGGYCGSSDAEALKAQAVAVYSYMKVKNYTLTGNDMACSATAYANLPAVVRSAVKAVLGEYLSYNGKAALTQFFASSAGKTTNSTNVWGGSGYPYLCGGVDSAENVSVSTVRVSAEDFKAIINAYNKNHSSNPITLSGDPSGWLEILEHDGARGNVGYISSIRVGDKVMSGNTFRTVFNSYRNSGTSGIKSHCFSFTVG